jgi:hypothetical protein
MGNYSSIDPNVKKPHSETFFGGRFYLVLVLYELMYFLFFYIFSPSNPHVG